MVDLLLPVAFLRSSPLRAFEIFVCNGSHACCVGCTSADSPEISAVSFFRYGLSQGLPLIIQRPAFVTSAKRVSVEILTEADPQLLPLFESSLLYRLQNSHIIVGSVEFFKVLSMELPVKFRQVLTTAGEIIDPVFEASTENTPLIKTEEPSPKKSLTSIVNGSEMVQLSGSFEFLSTPSTKGVFKIGPSTQLYISLTDAPTSLNITTGNEDVTHPDDNHSPLFGLEGIRSILQNYLRDFAVSSLCSSGHVTDVEHGILLYGLPGCGKSRLLKELIPKHMHSSGTETDPDWSGSLTFLTLSSALARTLCVSRPTSIRVSINPFYQWFLEQTRTTASRIVTPLVLLLPDLDMWIGPTPSDADEVEQVYSEETGNPNRTQFGGTSAVNHFFEAIERLTDPSNSVHYKVCVIATATTADGIFNLPEARRLFYRRILVPLPDAQTRFQILEHHIRLRLKSMCIPPLNALAQLSNASALISADEFFQDPHGVELLVLLASKLHGYTPRDLHRLLQVGFASLLSKLLSQTFSSDVTASGDGRTVPLSLSSICETLSQESQSYLQINLSQHTSPVGPLRWNDIGGYEQMKSLLRNVVQDRLTNTAKPDGVEARADAALGLRVPRGILLHGPPGCSKTMFVRALATECQLPLIAVQSSRIFGRYVGDSERNMRRVLVQARASAPAILFIDEIDLLLPSRSSSETGASEHVLGEVLTAMDGVEGQSGQVILIAATNRMDKLDSVCGLFRLSIQVIPPSALVLNLRVTCVDLIELSECLLAALSRAGRFDLVIPVPPPDAEARAAILRLELSRRAVQDGHLWLHTDWLDRFAEDSLGGYTGAELVQLVQHAAQLARESGLNHINRELLIQAQQQCPPVSLSTYVTSSSSVSTGVSSVADIGPPTHQISPSSATSVFLIALITGVFISSISYWFIFLIFGRNR
ncbi:hypothetical protein EG68_03243 [Paragonimus skrjabini miyazakii]|uniref:AAA+ ATPase domain-containing protein n=1 Tax=Paragonimus skrjabini miyazakii TaxID=59628 RepID=A0A8S9Z1F0_9TREM|nr:hypothetical protein EG68_03243 [Paragonimus skrjabini miyazakii]